MIGAVGLGIGLRQRVNEYFPFREHVVIGGEHSRLSGQELSCTHSVNRHQEFPPIHWVLFESVDEWLYREPENSLRGFIWSCSCKQSPVHVTSQYQIANRE